MKESISAALEVIDIEAKAILSLKSRIDDSFDVCCQRILSCKGRVIVLGMGKSGHIGAKIAATLASTGTPAFYVHPAEACHGDLGMITKSDLILAISNSGNTKEILELLPMIKRLKLPLIAITGNPQSILARNSWIFLNTAITREACPLNLAPTTSTTIALVMGDALAVALLKARQFDKHDFAKMHPGGALGRRLTLTVADVCHSQSETPLVLEQETLAKTLIEITRKKVGMACVVNSENRLVGILTDGDIRRALINNHDVYTTPVSVAMTRQCIKIAQETLVVDALNIMKKYAVTSLVVVSEEGEILGLLTIHDILKTDIVFEDEYAFINQNETSSSAELLAV
jgi:arabinose-5-phosphate isomerase